VRRGAEGSTGAGTPAIRFFRARAEFRRWLSRHHAAASELWVGFHKRSTGKPSLTWPESVDEALCFGWIDGIRKSVDAGSYTIRFTRRKEGSTWSAVNVRRARALEEEGRMAPAGLEAFRARRENRTGGYSYEQRPAELPEPYRAILRADRAAWTDFRSRPPWYRRAATWWVVSAKKEETRLRRLEALREASAAGRPVGPLARPAPARD
jgi:uncharacterized protein YdeI (YjbR/CyaY-like superfamily)